MCILSLCVAAAHMVFDVDLDVGSGDNSHILRLQNAVKEFILNSVKATTVGLWLHLHFPTVQYKKFKQSLDDLMEIPKVYFDQSHERIQKAVEKGERYHGQCFLEQLLIEKKLTEKEIILVSSLLFGGALDTVSAKRAIWLVLLLAMSKVFIALLWSY